jgi:hypothetical protein
MKTVSIIALDATMVPARSQQRSQSERATVRNCNRADAADVVHHYNN